MPAAEQPIATRQTRQATHVIPMGMDMPVSLPMMPFYAIVVGDSGVINVLTIPAIRQILRNIQTSLILRADLQDPASTV
jgi:hypothetical protein